MRSEQILKAAARVFSRKGYYHTRMQDIADEAEIGKGTVYEYFSSKEELFIELIKHGTEYYKELMEKEFEKDVSIWEKLLSLIERQVEFLWENRDFANLLIGRESQMITEQKLYGFLYEVRKKYIQRIASVFEKEMKQGTITSGDPELFAKIFIGTADQAVGATILLDKKKPGREEIVKIIDTLRHGFEK